MDIKKMMKLAFKEGNGCAQMPSDYWEGIDRDFEEWYLENFKLLDDQSEEVNEDSIKKYCGKVVATIEKSKHLDEGVKVVFTDDSYIECYWNSCEGDIALSITNENECKNKDANPMCRLPDEIPECYNNCPYYSPKYLDYDSIKELYGINDQILSLKDGNVYKYSGFLTMVGVGENSRAYDSMNEDLVVYKGGNLAKVIEKGIDHEGIRKMEHIQNVLDTSKRLGCTPSELLLKDYRKELGYDK